MAKSNYFWTEAQKIILANAYKEGGLPVAQKMLPEKTRSTIATQAHRLELTTPKPRRPKIGG